MQDTTQSTCATLAPGASCQLAFYLNEGAAAPTGYKERVVNVRMETLVGTLTVGSATLSATLKPATVEPSVTSVDFGVVGENTTESRTFTFTSTHGGSIEWRGVGSGANGISGSSNLVCGGVTVGYSNLIPPGATCTATVSFAPGIAASGARSATLAYNFNIGGVNTVLFSIAVSGQVEPVSYAVPFNDLDWGERPAHTALETRYAVVKNTAEKGRLDISSQFVPSPMSTSPGTATYTYEGVALPNCLQVGTLNPGASCYIGAAGYVIAGSPLMVGDRSGVLGLNSRNTFARVDVPFKVVYLPAQTNLSASNLVFETVTPSSTTHQPDLEVTLTNNGAGLAHISNTYTTSGNFWLVRHNGTVAQSVSRSAISGSPYCYDRSDPYLSQGQSCTLRVRFTPTGVSGTKTGTLSFTVNEPTAKNYNVPLSGVGSAGVVQTSATNLDFGTQLVGSTTERSVVIANNGDSDLSLRNFVIRRETGAASAWATTFVGSHNCPATLAPGEDCTFTVTFKPDENHNWSTINPREVVFFEHYTNGNWTGASLPLLAIAEGAQLKASQHSHNLGAVETGPVSDVFSRTVTYTASGTAPVRITALTPGVKGNYLELLAGGTCQTGLTLQPGESCTVQLRSLSTYSSFGAVGSTSSTPTLFSINGHYLGDTGAPQNSEFYTTSQILVNLVSPLSLSRTSPQVVSSQNETPMALSGGSFRAGMTLTVEGTTVPHTLDSAGQIRFTVPAGLAEGTRTLTLKHTDGLSSAKSLPLVAGNFAQDLSATQDVYTAMGDRPLSMSNISATSAQSAVLPDGRVLYYTPGLLSLVNPQTQQVLSSVTQGNLSYDYPVFNGPATQWGTPAAGSIAVTGNTVHVTDLVVLNNNHWIYTSCWQTCAYAWEYSTRIWERHSVYIISGDTLTLQASSNTAIYNYTTRRQHSTSAGTYEPAFERNVTVSGIQVAADPTNTSLRTVVQRYNITNLGSFGQIYRVSGTTPGTKYNLTASTNDSILGVAQNGSDVYVLNGNSVDTYTASSTSLTAGTRYTYSAALADSGSRGMTFNGTKTELLLGCYAGTTICRIPAVSGALGTINVLAGQVGTAGYADGSYGTALIRARSVGSAPNGASFLQPDVSPQAVRVVKRP